MSTDRARAPRCAGLTLIELMIVVVIVAILGLIAVPSYRQFVLRAHRTEAKAALLALQAQQQRWYLEHNAYTDDPTLLGFTRGLTESGAYAISIAAGAAGLTEGYVATAAPTHANGRGGVDMTRDAECLSFAITSQGRKLASPDPHGRCW